MTDAIHDQNRVKALLGVSYVDGTTLTPIKINSATGGMLIDQVNTISFTPTAITPRDHNFHTVVSCAGNDGNIYPLFVNPATGGVLVDLI